MGAVDETTGRIVEREIRPLAEVQTGYTSFAEGDVLFAKITPCMENGKVAMATELTNGMGRGSTEFYVLRPSDRILGEYIFHFVRQQRFRDQAKRNFTGTAGQQRVPKSFMEEALIPLPPIEEQRRIVDILNRAASIERLKARASAHLRDFIPALFLKMFGDPIENPMGWPVRPLADLCGIDSELRTPDVASEGNALCVGPDSFAKDTGVWIARTTVAEVIPRSGKYWFEKGDVLYSKIRPALRKCVLADRSGYCSADVYPLRCSQIATPEYLHALLLSQSFSDYAVGSSTRAQMPKINRKALFAYEAMCPPRELQDDYSRLVQAAAVRMKLADDANRLASHLSQSLLDKLLGTGGTDHDAREALTG